MPAILLNMSESFRPKQKEGNEPTNPERRKALEAIGGVGMVALSGVMVGGRAVEKNKDVNTESVTLSQILPESIEKFESTQSEVLNQLVEALKSGNREVFDHTLKYVYALREEKTAHLKRKSGIVAELTQSNNADPLQPFYLLENDRINKSLDEVDMLIQAVENAVKQSPLFNVPGETYDDTTESRGYSGSINLSDSVEKRKHNM
jgi:hypothetical protein